MEPINQICNFLKDEDVYNRDVYIYLIQRQHLRSRLQSLKDESLGLRKMQKMFELYEKIYAAQQN